MHFFRKMHISFPLPRGITQAPKQGSIASANRPLALPYLFNAVNEPRAAASVKFSAGKYASCRILFIAILAILQRDRRSRAKEKLERDAVMALFSADRRSFWKSRKRFLTIMYADFNEPYIHYHARDIKWLLSWLMPWIIILRMRVRTQVRAGVQPARRDLSKREMEQRSTHS